MFGCVICCCLCCYGDADVFGWLWLCVFVVCCFLSSADKQGSSEIQNFEGAHFWTRFLRSLVVRPPLGLCLFAKMAYAWLRHVRPRSLASPPLVLQVPAGAPGAAAQPALPGREADLAALAAEGLLDGLGEDEGATLPAPRLGEAGEPDVTSLSALPPLEPAGAALTGPGG